MVCVFVSLPSFVYSTFAEQFEVTPGRWHWRCAPTIVRQYAPAVIVEEMKAEVARNMPKLVLSFLAASILFWIMTTPTNAIDTMIELVDDVELGGNY